MNYIVKLGDNEYGPVDELTLTKWVEEDRIVAGTEVRSELIANWKKASDMPFLKEALANQHERLKASGVIDPNEGKEGILKRIYRVIWVQKEVKAFAMGYKPGFATLSNRFSAFCFDAVILAVVFILLSFGGFNAAISMAEKTTDQAPLAEVDNLILRKQKAKQEEVKAKGASAVETKENPQKAKQEKTEIEDNEALLEDTAKNIEKGLSEAADEVLKDLKIDTDINLRNGNFTAETQPTIFADSSAGYHRGYIWVNTADNNKHYICLSAEEGKALWIAKSDIGYIFSKVTLYWLPIVLLYYGLTLGYYAQTPGMWFYGIFICRRNQEEVYFFRALCFALLLVLFGWLLPIVHLIFKRGLHDMLTGVYVYSIVAKTSD